VISVLAADFDVDARTTIADALLNQRAVSGVGNVFKSETCFVAGIWPFTPLASIGDEGLRAILEIARRQLRANVHDPSSEFVMWGGMRRTTGRADPDARLYVYGREGHPCRRCGTRIAQAARGDDARLTYYCPACQAEGAPAS
jgi:endonuclease VIII